MKELEPCHEGQCPCHEGTWAPVMKELEPCHEGQCPCHEGTWAPVMKELDLLYYTASLLLEMKNLSNKNDKSNKHKGKRGNMEENKKKNNHPKQKHHGSSILNQWSWKE